MSTTPTRNGEARRVIPLAVQANAAPPGRASLRWLAVAPHRYFFFLGMLGLMAASLWWLAQLWARALGAPLAAALPPSWMHGWTMANGFLPFFMFGFTASVVPFLDAWRPLWLLAAFVSIVIAHGLLPVAGVLLPSKSIQALRLAVDVAGAALLFFVAWRWGVVQSLRNRLLAMLHLGFLWLGIAFALYAWNQAVALLDAPAASIGLAPLHALTMGFFGTVLLAMVTRVTAGHGGRTLAADHPTWVLFWVLQIAVLARVLADAAPAQGVWLTPAAIALWCIVFVTWTARSLPIYLKPRIDGRPG